MRIKLLILSMLITVMSFSQVKTFSAIRILDSMSLGGSTYFDTVIDISTYNGNLLTDSITANYLHLPNDTIFGATDTFVIATKTKINGDTISVNGDTLIVKDAMWVKNVNWSISPATSNWSVGIGTATPRGTFEVVDKILFNTNYISTAIGNNAGNSDHYRNTFIGSNAGQNITNSDNTAVGALTLKNSVYVQDNTAIGSSSGYNNTGNGNVFVGYKSGYENTADDNVFVGRSSGYYNTTGYSNVFVGNYSGFKNTFGYYNLFAGIKSGQNNTTGNFNNFIGYQAGYHNTTGSGNVFNGFQAGYYNNMGVDNTIVGTGAGYSSSGNFNVFMGYYTAYGNTTGSSNIAIGLNAGYSNSTRNFNILLGNKSGYYETGSNKLYISNSNTTTPLIYGEFDNSYLKFNADSVELTGKLKLTADALKDFAIAEGYSKYRKSKAITANYTVTLDDMLLVVAATTSDITITLPPRSLIPAGLYQVLEFVPVVTNGYKIRIQTQGDDTFPFGNTWFDLPRAQKHCEIGLGAHGFNLRRNITVNSSYIIDNLNATNFSTPTFIEWDAEDVNTQSQIIHWQQNSTVTAVAITNDADPELCLCTKTAHGLAINDRIEFAGATYTGTYKIVEVNANDFLIEAVYTNDDTQDATREERIYANTSGTYNISAIFTYNSTGGSTWNAYATLWKNGAEVPRTTLVTGNYGNEDNVVTSLVTPVELLENDYIQVQLDQTNLVGELLYSTLNISIRL